LRTSGVVGRRSERESHDQRACVGKDNLSSQDRDSSMARGPRNGRGICTVLESLAAYGKGWIARTPVERSCVVSRSWPALKGLKTSPGPQSLLGGSRSLKHVQGDVRSRGDGLQSCGGPSAPAGPSGAFSQSPVAASSPRTSLRRFPGKRLDQPQVASASASATTTASGRAALTRPAAQRSLQPS